jgi:hypothetical protein
MVHFIERAPEDGFRSQDAVLYRLPMKRDVLLASVVCLVFAPVCFFKGLPHESARVVAVGATFLGIASLAWGGISCELTFWKTTQILAIRWTFLGVEISARECKFESLRVFVRWWSGFLWGKSGGTVSASRPWLALSAAETIFLFPRPARGVVEEQDIPLLLYELGMSASLPNQTTEPDSLSRAGSS